MSIIIERDDLSRLHEKYSTIVSTNGCFDLLHIGHKRLLEKCRALGDCLVVGINSDESVKNLKGPDRPLVPQDERAELLASFGFVDYVHIFDEPVPDGFIAVLKPHIHCKGADYTLEQIGERQVVERHGGEVVIIDITPGKSTSGLITKIQSVHAHISLDALADAVTIDDGHEWGKEHRLINNELYCAKFLEYTNSDHAGSDHFHKEKLETFKVLEGRLMIAREYRVGDEIMIPRTYRHFVKAITDHAVLLEASTHHEDTDTYRVAFWTEEDKNE